jgi:hypothetical protein
MQSHGSAEERLGKEVFLLKANCLNTFFCVDSNSDLFVGSKWIKDIDRGWGDAGKRRRRRRRRMACLL